MTKKTTVDDMIEGWAKKAPVKPDPEEETHQAIARAATRAGQKSMDKVHALIREHGEPSDLDAARAVRKALAENTGRRKMYDAWVNVVKESLGIKRLPTARYEAVLKAGYDAGYFRLDSKTLSFPILVLDAPSSAPPTPAPSTPAPPVTPTDLGAARAVRKALVENTGRRKKYDVWVEVVKQALGIKRLTTVRFEAVLKAGYKAGLFRLDTETLSFPILVPEDLPDPDPVPAEVSEEPLVEAKVAPPPKPFISPPIPENWQSPKTLPCGHTDWFTEAQHQEAQKEGHCCPDFKSTNYRWQVRGLTHPVAIPFRRSKDKEGREGWPGLCCDPVSGLYIGGTGNDCRRADQTARCIVHARE